MRINPAEKLWWSPVSTAGVSPPFFRPEDRLIFFFRERNGRWHGRNVTIDAKWQSATRNQCTKNPVWRFSSWRDLTDQSKTFDHRYIRSPVSKMWPKTHLYDFQLGSEECDWCRITIRFQERGKLSRSKNVFGIPFPEEEEFSRTLCQAYRFQGLVEWTVDQIPSRCWWLTGSWIGSFVIELLGFGEKTWSPCGAFSLRRVFAVDQKNRVHVKVKSCWVPTLISQIFFFLASRIFLFRESHTRYTITCTPRSFPLAITAVPRVGADCLFSSRLTIPPADSCHGHDNHCLSHGNNLMSWKQQLRTMELFRHGILLLEESTIFLQISSSTALYFYPQPRTYSLMEKLLLAHFQSFWRLRTKRRLKNV